MQENDDEIIDNQKETESQKLPDLYITGRNELSKEYDKNVIHFEAETGTPTHAKPENKQEETEVPLDIVNSHEMAADNDLSFENDENEEVAEAALQNLIRQCIMIFQIWKIMTPEKICRSIIFLHRICCLTTFP